MIPVEHFINFNGRYIRSDLPVIKASSPGFRYGLSLFETLRVKEGMIELADLHFRRLFDSAEQLHLPLIEIFNREEISRQVKECCRKNNCLDSARVRLTVFESEGTLSDKNNTGLQYLVECWSIPKAVFEESNWIIDIYPGVRKSCDAFSNYKTGNFMEYALAARYAKQKGWNDSILLNGHGRICDSSIANIFYVKDKKIYTPALTEGCVAGTIRNYLIRNASLTGMEIIEKTVEISDLLDASEIFLTNALSAIRPIHQFRDRLLKIEKSKLLWQLLLGHLPAE